jgi:hypothetical protein
VQALILEEQPLATYTHCFSHSLNLALSKACSVSVIRNTLGTIGEISVFLSSSAKRVEMLKTAIDQSTEQPSKKKKLKPYCETRWVERHDSIVVFDELLVYIIQVLELISETGDVLFCLLAYCIYISYQGCCNALTSVCI